MARTYESDEELASLARLCEERGIAKECGKCRRSLATCRQHHDLPMRMKKALPICNACYQTTGGTHKMATRINWTKAQPGSDMRLYQELLEMREAGLTHSEIRAELKKRHEIEVSIGNVAKALKRYRDGAAVKEAADKIAWAEPMEGSDRPLWEEAKAIKEGGMTWKETAEELQTRYGISVLPGTASGMVLYYSKAGKGERTKGKGEQQRRNAEVAEKTERTQRTTTAGGRGQSPEVTVPGEQRETSPCLLHLARDGFEIWISARDENEFLTKMQQAQNLMQMAGAL